VAVRISNAELAQYLVGQTFLSLSLRALSYPAFPASMASSLACASFRST